MTLDEAIKHAEEVAKEQDKLCKRYDDASGYTRSHNEDIRTTDAKKCAKCAEEHRQLAEWLKELKARREQDSDTISKQAVNTLVDELARAISDERCCMSRGRSTATIMQDILELPSLTPQPKMGQWIESNNPSEKYTCSNCGGACWYYDYWGTLAKSNYCPNCGARMEARE